MARSRGRKVGGQPGNLNAVRGGYDSWRRRRALPARLTHIRTFVEREEQALLTDKGGKDAVTAGEMALIRDAGTAYGLILLLLEESATRGTIVTTENGWDLAAGLQKIKGLIDTRRSNFQALGLERRARDVTPTIAEIQKRYEDGKGK